MKKIITSNFIINYPESLYDFVKNSLTIFDKQMPLIKSTFNCDDNTIGKLKVIFFADRNDFVAYIKSITGNDNLPTWVIGCYCNGEIQILVNMNNENEENYKLHTLTHESVHLYINKLIYEKYKIDRVRWFDESYANYIDGRNKPFSLKDFKKICYKLKFLGDFDMNSLKDAKNFKTNMCYGYAMFLIIGKYIFENNLAKEYLETIKINPAKIQEIGLTILKKAILYIEKL